MGFPFGGTDNGDEQDRSGRRGLSAKRVSRDKCPLHYCLTAAIVGQDEQAGRFGVALAAVAPPPVSDRSGREGGCISRGTDRDTAAVGLEVVHAVGNGDAIARRREIMVVDLDGFAALDLSRVLEVNHQLAFLGIDG
jgi:hypothetical protein